MRLYEVTDPDYMNMVRRDCKPFLNQANGGVVYRGTYNDLGEFGKITIRKDRRPVSFNKEENKLLINAFAQAGIKANRDNSVFCTGDAYMAKDYGNLYQIFPIGNFDYAWAEEIPYLFHWTEEHYNVDPEMYPVMIKQAYHNNAFFKEAISSGNEIMIACKQYFIVKHSLIREMF